MALKICSFNCKGFNVSKVKHIENVLKQCDLLLFQETWALPRDVRKIIQYFPKYNTFGVSTINDDVILVGRPYGGCSFLYRKPISSNIEIKSNCICCISLNTNIVKFIFLMCISHVTTQHRVLFNCIMKCYQLFPLFYMIIML